MHEAHSTTPPVQKVAQAAAIVVTSLVAVAGFSRFGAVVAVLDGVAAALIMAPAMLVGLVLLRLTPLRGAPARWQLLVGVALGLGLLSSLVLLLGLAGFLGRTVWAGVLIGMFAVGVIGSRDLVAQTRVRAAAPADGGSSGASRSHLLWWTLVPFLTLALLAAAHPPGLLWAEEGFGYDALEYHLQLPREYLDAGTIEYLAHNVYGSFPAATEMLYMLAMIMHGKVQDAGTIANMIHLAFGVLAVFAAWVAGREWSRDAGVVAAIAVGSAGWLAYLSGLAYVENAMLFFGMTATGALVRALRTSSEERDARPRAIWWIAVSGFCAGCACACKYTGAAFVLLPLLMALGAFHKVAIAVRFRRCGVFCIAAMVPFAPWLIKNQVWTGNPVFPLANSMFGSAPEGWGEGETVAWDRGHSLKDEDRAIGRRLALAWSHSFADPAQRFGPVVLFLGLLGLAARRRDRIDGALALMLVAQVLAWIFATHLFARFAVVLLIPLSLLLARSVIGSSRRRTRLILTIVAAGAVWNAVFAVRLYAGETVGPAPASLFYEGELPGYEYVGFANKELPENAKLLMLGEARAFYFTRPVDYCVTFNRNPFLARLFDPGRDGGVRRWVSQQGYTHVLIHYDELRRLSRTYGTSPPLSAEQYASLPLRMREAGFRLIREFAFPGRPDSKSYVAIYRVPDERDGG